MLVVALSLALGLAQAAPGAAASLPGDARLDPVRVSLEQKLARAGAAGLPQDVIVTKVREGLAKGVDPARIEAAVARLTDSLGAAQKFVAARRPGGAPPSVVRAVAEAQMAGVALSAIDPLIRDARPEIATRRAVEMVTDLVRRQYPADRAASVVRAALTSDPGSLDRVPGTLETIRQDHGLSQAEAVDALARGFGAGGSLKAAHGRTVEGERLKGNGRSRAKTSDTRDGPGKSSLAPGHLPKVKKTGRGRMK